MKELLKETMKMQEDGTWLGSPKPVPPQMPDMKVDEEKGKVKSVIANGRKFWKVEGIPDKLFQTKDAAEKAAGNTDKKVEEGSHEVHDEDLSGGYQGFQIKRTSYYSVEDAYGKPIKSSNPLWDQESAKKFVDSLVASGKTAHYIDADVVYPWSNAPESVNEPGAMESKVKEARTIGARGKSIVRSLVAKAKSSGMTGMNEISDYVIENIPEEVLDSWEGAHDEVRRLATDMVMNEAKSVNEQGFGGDTGVDADFNMSDEAKMRAALEAFVDAGYKLIKVWDHDLVYLYPDYLPSFDDFLEDFSGMMGDADESRKHKHIAVSEVLKKLGEGKESKEKEKVVGDYKVQLIRKHDSAVPYKVKLIKGGAVVDTYETDGSQDAQDKFSAYVKKASEKKSDK